MFSESPKVQPITINCKDGWTWRFKFDGFAIHYHRFITGDIEAVKLSSEKFHVMSFFEKDREFQTEQFFRARGAKANAIKAVISLLRSK